jgi:hypothetical protein
MKRRAYVGSESGLGRGSRRGSGRGLVHHLLSPIHSCPPCGVCIVPVSSYSLASVVRRVLRGCVGLCCSISSEAMTAEEGMTREGLRRSGPIRTWSPSLATTTMTSTSSSTVLTFMRGRDLCCSMRTQEAQLMIAVACYLDVTTPASADWRHRHPICHVIVQY